VLVDYLDAFKPRIYGNLQDISEDPTIYTLTNVKEKGNRKGLDNPEQTAKRIRNLITQIYEGTYYTKSKPVEVDDVDIDEVSKINLTADMIEPLVNRSISRRKKVEKLDKPKIRRVKHEIVPSDIISELNKSAIDPDKTKSHTVTTRPTVKYNPEKRDPGESEAEYNRRQLIYMTLLNEVDLSVEVSDVLSRVQNNIDIKGIRYNTGVMNILKQYINTDQELPDEPVQNLSDEPVENVSDELVENVSDELVENVSDEPVENISEEPEKNVLEEPEKNVLEEPEENVSDEPVENVLEEPEENVLEEPEENVLEEPEENVLEEPEENVLEELEENVLEEPEENVLEEPEENVLEEPEENVLKEPEENVLEEPEENLSDELVEDS